MDPLLLKRLGQMKGRNAGCTQILPNGISEWMRASSGCFRSISPFFFFFFFCYPSVVDVPSSPGEKHSLSLLLWTDSLTPVQAFSFVNHLTLQRLDRQLSEVRRAGTWKGREGCLPLEQHSSSQHKRPNNCFIHSLTHSVLQPAISLHLSHCPSSLLPLIFLSVHPFIHSL